MAEWTAVFSYSKSPMGNIVVKDKSTCMKINIHFGYSRKYALES
jgi:hypothetical protein